MLKNLHDNKYSIFKSMTTLESKSKLAKKHAGFGKLIKWSIKHPGLMLGFRYLSALAHALNYVRPLMLTMLKITLPILSSLMHVHHDQDSFWSTVWNTKYCWWLLMFDQLKLRDVVNPIIIVPIVMIKFVTIIFSPFSREEVDFSSPRFLPFQLVLHYLCRKDI